VLDHCGWPIADGPPHYGLDEAHRALTTRRNIYFKFTTVNLEALRLVAGKCPGCAASLRFGIRSRPLAVGFRYRQLGRSVCRDGQPHREGLGGTGQTRTAAGIARHCRGGVRRGRSARLGARRDHARSATRQPDLVRAQRPASALGAGSRHAAVGIHRMWRHSSPFHPPIPRSNRICHSAWGCAATPTWWACYRVTGRAAGACAPDPRSCR